MKTYSQIIILWAIIIVISMQRPMVELAYVTVPFTLIYLIWCAYYLLFKKKPSKEIGIKFLIITLSYSTIAVVQVARFKEARNNAESVLAKIQAFNVMHGKYPANSLEIGLSDEELRKQRLFYVNTPSGPDFFYPATQAPLDTYSFNFKKLEWEYHAD